MFGRVKKNRKEGQAMKYRTYNTIKNIMLGSCAATFYNLSIVESIPVVKEVVGTVAIFGAIVMLLGESDKAFAIARKAKREARKAAQEVKEDQKKSA